MPDDDLRTLVRELLDYLNEEVLAGEDVSLSEADILDALATHGSVIVRGQGASPAYMEAIGEMTEARVDTQS